MTDALEKRLQALTGNEALALGATIRPPLAGAGLESTLAAGGMNSPEARPVPRVSVAESAESDDALGASDFSVDGLLGEGGMGRVLLARQYSLDRHVALKTVKKGATLEACKALLLEGRVTGRLEHPSIVPVHALGVDEDDQPILVMKRIEGTSWDVLIADPAHEGWEGWDGDADDRLLGHLQVLQQICQALRFAHRNGVVHLDIKPANILIGRFGDVYVADWGIAATSGEKLGHLCGTAHYMAPEMVEEGVVDERTDVYMLGAVLHDVLTGRPRHDEPSVLAAMLAAMKSKPYEYGDEVPAELGALANAACHKDPEQRPQTAGAFREALVAYIQHRDAMSLTRVAIERMRQGTALLAKDELNIDERRQLDRHFAAAQFGLEEAVAQWDDNTLAQETLVELETILDAQRSRAEALERLARELDPGIAARTRAVALSAQAVFGVVLGAWTLRADPATLTGTYLLVVPLLVGACVAGLGVVFRRKLWTTRFNRQTITMVLLLLALIFVHRLGVVIRGPFELATVFVTDHFIVAASFALGAITLLPWAIWLSLVATVGGVSTLLFPEHALTILGCCTTTELVLAAILSWRHRIA